MGRTYLSKILAISSNPHTIMLLLIVGEFGYPEVCNIEEQREKEEKTYEGCTRYIIYVGSYMVHGRRFLGPIDNGPGT